MISTLIGAGSGVLIKVWANALGKQRYLAQPWVHVTLGFAGGYIGYNYNRWEQSLIDSVNTLRQERGLTVIKRETMLTSLWNNDDDEDN